MKPASNRASGTVLILRDLGNDWGVITAVLHSCGFAVRTASTYSEALMRLRRHDYDAVLLDMGLVETGGVRACSNIRAEFPDIWIIVVAAQDSREDWVDAINAGADHCIDKPLQKRELAARIRAISRRLRTKPTYSRPSLIVGNVHLDLAKHVVKREGSEIRLTSTEFNVLYQLMASAGRPISYSALLDIVWGDHTAKEREYLRIYISQLRKKLEVKPAQPRFLLTCRGIGYIFSSPGDITESIQ